MSMNNMATTTCLLALLLMGPAVSAEQNRPRDATGRILDEITAAVEDAVSEVVHETSRKAKGVVREHTGIDLEERGYGGGRSHKPFPGGVSEETRRELRQLEREHDRTLYQLEEELDRKLARAREEFEREAAREDKVEKVREKRAKLEEKVDEAYATFDEKVSAENRRFDEKRDEILTREVERDYRGIGPEREGAAHERRAERGAAADFGDGRKRDPGRGEAAGDDAPETAATRGDDDKAKPWWEFWK
jgi:hypothetical protein